MPCRVTGGPVSSWLADERTATVFPGSDAFVVTAAEQHAVDERVRRRIGAMQAEILRAH